MKIPVEQLDGSIQQVQMTADNFSLQALLDEQQRLVNAQLAMNENMTTLLNEGQAAIVQQAKSLPPELQGVFLKSVMEMSPEERAKLNGDFLSQQQQLADSGARVVEAGYGTLDLTTPTVAAAVTARAGMVDAFGQPVSAPVQVDANTAAAEQAINDAARDRSSTIYVTEQRTVADVSGGGYAFHYGRHGMVWTYAKGGKAGPHVARDGAKLQRWAEPGTGGEIFVPRNTDRSRALDILAIGAAWHNAQVVPYRYGGSTVSSGAGPRMATIGAAASMWNVSLTVAPRVDVHEAASATMTGREIVRQLKDAVPELGEMLRRETAGRR